MDIVHLAAGVGSRLGKPHPKPLTVLTEGESILGRQQRLLAGSFPDARNVIVVGFKKDMVMEEFPESLFVYNAEFGDTNTSKSLLRALKATGPSPILWLNGDVVFNKGLLGVIERAIDAGDSFVAVNTGRVAEEEVKYTVDEHGWIREISKTVREPLGEAVGINFVSTDDKAEFIEYLEACGDNDYFERGIELAIEAGAIRFRPVDISEFPCIEVDFADDLAKALELLD